MDQTWSNTPCKQVSLTCFVSQNKQRQKTHTHTQKKTNKQKTWPVVLGDNGLGALTDGVLGQLTREKEARGLKKHEICIECDQYTGRKKIIKSEGKKNNKHRKETRAKNAFCSHTGGKTQESNNNCTVTVTMQWHTKRVRSISECGGCKTTLVWNKAHEDCKNNNFPGRDEVWRRILSLGPSFGWTLAIRDSGDIFNVMFPGFVACKYFRNCWKSELE